MVMSFQTDFQHWWHGRLRRPFGLHVSIRTEEGTPLLLLHGLGSGGLAWQGLVRQTGSRWQVVAPDLLGFGRSPQPDFIDYTVDDHAKAVAKVIRQTYGRKRITVMAHSMGCLVAIRLSQMRGVKIDRLILYEPPLLSVAEARRLKRLPRYKDLYRRAAENPQVLMTFSKLLARVISETPFNVSSDNWLPNERSLRNTILRQDAIEVLENIRIRTDIAYGRFDFIVDSKSARRKLKKNPFIHFHQINDTHGVSRLSNGALVKLLDKPRLTETKPV
ncbi:MAG: alpha/beta hydrolase [Candidatus Saccharibacteria bacterium]|nr:alpha/beta hydrolase [Candidatus Saccharibacteria bacterium]